jgi:hypothetical protein
MGGHDDRRGWAGSRAEDVDAENGSVADGDGKVPIGVDAGGNGKDFDVRPKDVAEAAANASEEARTARVKTC